MLLALSFDSFRRKRHVQANRAKDGGLLSLRSSSSALLVLTHFHSESSPLKLDVDVIYDTSQKCALLINSKSWRLQVTRNQTSLTRSALFSLLIGVCPF